MVEVLENIHGVVSKINNGMQFPKIAEIQKVAKKKIKAVPVKVIDVFGNDTTQIFEASV